jgi:hypothetical protein
MYIATGFSFIMLYPVLFILINLHIGTNKKCSRNQWGMSIERSIIYYERQLCNLFRVNLAEISC